MTQGQANGLPQEYEHKTEEVRCQGHSHNLKQERHHHEWMFEPRDGIQIRCTVFSGISG